MCGWQSAAVASTSEGRDAYSGHSLREIKRAKKQVGLVTAQLPTGGAS